jgi:DnaJ-class molecular chaperone
LDESDIILTLPLSPLDLLPLGQMTIPSLHGNLTVAGVEMDEFQHPTLNLPGRGYPLSENSKKFGDLFVRFVIDVPPSIDENLRIKLREIKQALPKSARQKELDKFLRS